MKSKKRFIAACISMVLVSLSVTPAFSATEPDYPVSVYLDGNLIDFGGVKAQIIHDYAYVPIAEVIETLTGVRPNWSDSTKSATFKLNGDSFKIIASQKGIYVNDKFIEFDTPPEHVNDRILIPMKMLSEALRFEQQWDNDARIVKMTSPAKYSEYPPSVISLDPDNAQVASGEKVEFKVKAGRNTTSVKVVNADNTMMAESKDFQRVGDENIYTLSFNAHKTGKYRVYSASLADGYNINSFQDINITVASDVGINSVNLSSSSVSLGDRVTVTIYATQNTKSVTLVGDTNKNDVVRSTSYYDDGINRVFELNWYLQERYYSSLGSASARVYAGNDDKSNAQSVSVNISKASPTIYSATALPSTVVPNGTSRISVITNTSVNRLTINDYGTGFSDEITRYNDVDNRRYWEFDKKVSWSGSRSIEVIAYSTGNTTARKEVTITVSNANAYLKAITLNQPNRIYAGDEMIFYVETGTSVDRIEAATNQGINFRTSSYSSNNNIKYWTLTIKTTANKPDLNVKVAINVYDVNGNIVETNDQVVNVKARVR